MYFQLVGKPPLQHTTTTTTIETATQCDDLEFPDPQKIISELQAGYTSNLELVKQQMDTTNRESLAMLKVELEKDHDTLMHMLQDSLTTAHDDNILALNMAHEEEVGMNKDQ